MMIDGSGSTVVFAVQESFRGGVMIEERGQVWTLGHAAAMCKIMIAATDEEGKVK